MKYFSVPSDFSKSTIDEYNKLNIKYDDSKITETYGSITKGNYFGSGRLTKQMKDIDLFDLQEYINYSKEHDIDFNYTINSPFLNNIEFTKKGVEEIKVFLGNLYGIGVRSLTISIPSVIELVRSTKYDFKIKASTICQIVNPTRAHFYKSLGVDKIVTDESINRDFKMLETIRKVFGDKVEVIANQICDLNCIYRMFHYNMISGEKQGSVNDVSINYFEHRCVMQQYKSVDNLLKLSWIRPEDLKYYSQIGINYFKLQGRHTFIKKGNPVRTVETYMNESFDGNLYELLSMFAIMNNFYVEIDNKKLDGFIKPFAEKENFCDHLCSECGYCESFATKAINIKKTSEVMDKAKAFYDEYDQFKKLIEDKPVNNSLSKDLDKESKFDF